MTCAPAILGLLLCVTQPPDTFENPDQGGRPAIGQRVLKDWRAVPGMVVEVECEFAPCIMRASGHISFQITKYASEDCRLDDWFLLASKVTVNGEDASAVFNGNFARREHYVSHPFYVTTLVEAGTHTVAVEVRQHRKTPGDCRLYIKQPKYSRLQVEIIQ